MTTQSLTLPWKAPPLMSNNRYHWAKRNTITGEIRQAVKLLARALTPVSTQVIIRVTWVVTDRRVRDAGSIAPTGKAAIDALVDAGVIRADHWGIVIEERYRIVQGKTEAVVLEILPVEATVGRMAS